ncbi:hypothetical protein WJT74_07515 [Sphingomicrobium sp. XHP0239]|uniref:ArnT family glycosyltransferase n=1 Tax=Sphingomicrobium maritimum TaxID=3133972 RepID=UPI0031CC4F55
MTTTTRAATDRRRDAIAMIGIAIVVLVLRLPLHSIAVLSVDESAYMLVARDLLDGVWPFAGNFDHKPVGIYYHYAVAMGLGGEDPSSIRWLTTIAALVSALVLFWMARALAQLPLFFAVTVAIVWSFASFGLEGFSANTEMIIAPYLIGWIATFLAFARGHAGFVNSVLLSGAFAGVAVQINYLGGPLLACLYVAALVGAPRAGLKWALASGSVSILVALLQWLPLIVAGTLPNYLLLQAEFLFNYQGTADRVAWDAVLPPLLGQLLPLLVIVLVALVLLRPGRDQRDFVVIGSGATIGGLGAALTSFHLYAHYFYLVLPGLFILAIALLAAAEGTHRRLFAYALIAAGIPGLLIVLGELDRGYTMPTPEQLTADPGIDRNRAVAAHYRPVIPAGSTGYVVCDQPALYLLLDLEDVTDTPFWILHLYPFLERIDAAEEVAFIRAEQPEFLLIGTSCTPAAEALVRSAFADYRRADEYLNVELWTAPQARLN